MKSRKQLNETVLNLSKQLPEINPKAVELAYRKAPTKRLATVVRGTHFCLECGHSWVDKNMTSEIGKSVNCPSCHKRVTIRKAGNIETEKMYGSEITSIDGFQVVRLFVVSKSWKRNEPAAYGFVGEAMQHFIDPSGTVVTLERPTVAFSSAYDLWQYYKEMKVNPGKSYRQHLRFRINPWTAYLTKRVIGTIKRNGFAGKFHDVAPHILFQAILTDSVAETLLKAKQINALEYHLNSRKVYNFFPLIKICIRNGYIIPDFSIWKDYIELLEFFGRDTRSAKYICPADLTKAHDRLVEKKREQERKKKFADLKSEIEKAQKKYQKTKQPFLKMEFKNGNLSVSVFQTVKQFLDEGDILEHCIFRNEYYAKKDSLLLSARVDGKPIETVEISLSTMQVVQCRGFKNEPSKYNKKIIKLVTDNIPKIASVYKNRKLQTA